MVSLTTLGRSGLYRLGMDLFRAMFFGILVCFLCFAVVV